jgi:predicted nucleic acid-binding protein
LTAIARVLVDSSIWIDHFNKSDAELEVLLKRRRVVVHPMVIGEVALGSLASRARVLQELHALPHAKAASHAEVIEWMQLFNRGIGYIDVHLLASVRQIKDGQLWPRDKRLHAQAERLGVAFAM